MAIPESQLQAWGNIGATDLLRNHHASFKNLDSFKGWQESVTYDPYLQGSYRIVQTSKKKLNKDLEVVK